MPAGDDESLLPEFAELMSSFDVIIRTKFDKLPRVAEPNRRRALAAAKRAQKRLDNLIASTEANLQLAGCAVPNGARIEKDWHRYDDRAPGCKIASLASSFRY